MWERCARQIKRAVDIRLEGEIEVFVGQLFERRRMLLERGVVDDDVELAEFGERSLDRASTEGCVADVAANENAAPLLFLFDDATRLFGVAVGFEINDGDVGTLAREEHGDGTSDAGVAAADQRNHSFEFAAAAIERIVEHRPRPDLRLQSRLLLMLLRHRKSGVGSRTGLHARLVFLRCRLACVGAIDFRLNVSLTVDCTNGLAADASFRSHADASCKRRTAPVEDRRLACPTSSSGADRRGRLSSTHPGWMTAASSVSITSVASSSSLCRSRRRVNETVTRRAIHWLITNEDSIVNSSSKARPYGYSRAIVPPATSTKTTPRALSGFAT